MSQKLKITMFKTANSGSNTYFLNQNIPNDIKTKYNIRLITNEDAERDPHLHDSDIYINTHGQYMSSEEKINIELWHGFPLKGMAKMDIQETASSEKIHHYWSQLDKIMSYSPLYNTLMNACNGARITQYSITGMPRNDALFNADSRDKLLKFFPELKDHKAAFFMPTFRRSVITPKKLEGGKDFHNIFGFESFDKHSFQSFLTKNNLKFIVKLHPFEEAFYKQDIEEWKKYGLLFLTDEMLKRHALDLYELLGAADLLITDYSSVYFDYLLLDRPILFLPVDLQEYQQTRGFLIDPYDFWAPGPKALTQDEMQQEAAKLLGEKSYFEQERETIKKMVHSFTDNKSTERVWKEIDKTVSEVFQQRREEQNKKAEMEELQGKVRDQISKYIEQGSLELAEQTIKEYEQSSGTDAPILSIKGILYFLQGKTDAAIDLLTAGHRLYDKDAHIMFNLGYIYQSVGNLNSASHYYTLAMKNSTEPELLEAARQQVAQLS
ncbi:CDP-glycerol glycerophosphotransferase family protein [Paenibacillus pinistramenti]|uniref:CDP-glycerol glycerophosphotransferase family protein n=1 Tax=Paenibacillus pinistramenti TaxID=1768003 RepID=UPI001109849C|nr:CDP-glycerol glycerophosphotransferase family protein [Paenibacillus pinistramenti]